MPRLKRGSDVTTKGFTVSYLHDAHVESALRAFFGTRDLGIAAASGCRVAAQVIRQRGIGHSEDVERLEIVMPADFATGEVPAV